MIEINCADYLVAGCEKVDLKEQYHTIYALEADGSVCTVYDSQPIIASDKNGTYLVNVDMFNTQTSAGYFGIMYNVIDENNYDFVYLR